MALNPLDQFAIKPLLPLQVAGLDISITNQTLWLFAAVVVLGGLLLLAVRRMLMVPGRAQAAVEMIYEFMHSMVADMAGQRALRFLPGIFTLFLFIATMNLLGMVPGSYTVTSQLFTTLTMSLVAFAVVVLTGIAVNGWRFFAHFLPPGTPLWMAPLIVPLEIISFLVRPLTLAVRLAVNMIAGHILLKLFATFVIMMMSLGGFAFLGIVPFAALVAISGLEVFVAVLQAYIFTVLTCVYLGEALQEHHHDDAHHDHHTHHHAPKAAAAGE